MIADEIVTMLLANGGVSAVAGTRVYQDELPRGFVMPAAVVHKYSGRQEYDFAGPVGVTETHVQVDVYGKTPSERDGLVTPVKAALIDFKGTLSTTVVQGCYLEREMDMPTVRSADATGSAFRTVLGFQVLIQRS